MTALITVLIVVATILILKKAFIVRTKHFAGEYKKLTPHYSGTYTRVEDLPGPGDMVIDSETGLVFISAGDGRDLRDGVPTSRGDIYSFDFKTEGAVPRKLTGGFEREFHPDGISLYRDPGDGRLFVFVVNHTIRNPEDGEFVEIFEYIDGVLEHRESISHPLMFRPYGIVAVGPRSFYATNHHGTYRSQKIMRKLETHVPLRKSYVMFYNGTELRIVADRIAIADGINLSADGKMLYVGASLEKALNVYSRNDDTGDLTFSFKVPLGTMPDKIRFDGKGNLYIAAHPKILSRTKHNDDVNKRSPSQVLKITIKGENSYSVDEIYLNDGTEISAAGVAAPFDGGMLLGAARMNHLLICRDK